METRVIAATLQYFVVALHAIHGVVELSEHGKLPTSPRPLNRCHGRAEDLKHLSPHTTRGLLKLFKANAIVSPLRQPKRIFSSSSVSLDPRRVSFWSRSPCTASVIQSAASSAKLNSVKQKRRVQSSVSVIA